MAGLSDFAWPGADARPVDERSETRCRRTRRLWLAVSIDPPPDSSTLETLARFAESLTPVVVIDVAGLALEVQGSLKYFSGLEPIKRRLCRQLEHIGVRHRFSGYRLATAPTLLAAQWLVRCKSMDILDEGALAGALGRLPLACTGWPERVQVTLKQMGLRSIADCLRLPRAGFARRIGRARLDELDRALGRQPEFPERYQPPRALSATVDLTAETCDQAVLADALDGMLASFERSLRRRQMQLREIELSFRHLRCRPTQTRLRFVEPVHERKRILDPLLERIERLQLAEPVIGLSLQTGTLAPLVADPPALPLSAGPSAGPDRGGSEHALIESLRGRFGTRGVHGIDCVAEHRPEYAWRHWIDRPASAKEPPACPAHGRPLWLLPRPVKNRGQTLNWGQTPILARRKSSSRSTEKLVSDPNLMSDPDFSVERIESGWWDGREVRRDYHVVIGEGGEKFWYYRDCLTKEWYLHGIFG